MKKMINRNGSMVEEKHILDFPFMHCLNNFLFKYLLDIEF